METASLETRRAEREQAYRSEGQTLVKRFKSLSGNVKEQLKASALRQLETLLPKSGRREEMLRDLTFQKMANRTVLESFFEWVDQGIPESKALQMI